MHTPFITNDLEKVVKAIQVNKIVAFPTGTVYGLAGNALSTEALNSLRIIKKRPKEKTFTVFLDDSRIDDFFEVTSYEKKLIDRAGNAPLSILLKPKAALQHLAFDGLVGLRLIDHPLMKALSEVVSYPLTATSANLAGEEACVTPECIVDNLPGVELVYGGTELVASKPSSIIRLDERELRVIRAGSLSKEELTKLI